MMAGSSTLNNADNNQNLVPDAAITSTSSTNGNNSALIEKKFQIYLPPEDEMGNIEYKSHLINPTLSRLQHLSTQMKWRLSEGGGEAFYEIGVNDDGSISGLSPDQMDASLKTIQKMATCINASVSVIETRVMDRDTENPKFSLRVMVRKLPDSKLKSNLRIAIIGNAQSGKSTMCGVLTQGVFDNGKGQARISTFRHLHEFRSGKTSSICYDLIGFTEEGKLLNYKLHSLEELLMHSAKLVTLIDLAGDRKFLKTTIYGMSGYFPHYCALVVNARQSVTASTEEHFELAIALGIPVLVVVTKVDLVNAMQLQRVLDRIHQLIHPAKYWQMYTEESVKSFVPSKAVIPLFCISNVTGQGIDLLTQFFANLPQQPLPLLKNVESQNSLAQGEMVDESKPLFYVEELFRTERVGLIICGLLAEGCLAEGDQIKFGPDRAGLYTMARVESIHQNKQPVMRIFAGDSASITLNTIDNEPSLMTLRRGMVLIDADASELFCWRFTARFYLLYHPLEEICVGFQGTVYIGSLRRTVTIVDFDAPSISPAIWLRVTFKFVQRPEFLRIGMPLFFREAHTRAMGMIVDVEESTTTMGE